MIKHRNHFYRLASKEIMYHGTATGTDDEILNRILKEGLNPQPKKRVFTEDDDRRDIATLGGIYLSKRPLDVTKFSTMAKNKFGGKEMVAIVQFETRTPQTTLDEDELFPVGRHSVYLDTYAREHWNLVEVNNYLLLGLLEEDKIDWTDVAKHFMKNKVEAVWGKLDSREVKRSLPVVADVMKWQAFYRAAEEQESARFGGDYRYNDIIGVSSTEALSSLRQAIKEALRRLRSLATPPTDLGDWKTQMQHGEQKIQTEQPITYRGANKILAVLVFDRVNAEDYYVVGQVVYATTEGMRLAEDLIKNSFRQHLGQPMHWTGPNGEVIYSEQRERAAAVVYKGRLYTALPYKTAPAIPNKLQTAALEADNWLRSLSRDDFASVIEFGENYVERSLYDAEQIAYWVDQYKNRAWRSIEDQLEDARSQVRSRPMQATRMLTEGLQEKVEILEGLENSIQEWKEYIEWYFDSFFPQGLDLADPTKAEDLQELNEDFEYDKLVVPVVKKLYKILEASEAVRQYAEYRQNLYSYELKKQQNRGDSEKTFPKGVEEKEIMYHVTTNAEAIKKTGFKSKRQLFEEAGRPTGLGGGQDDRISFTASLEHAKGIKQAILDMIALAKSPPTAEQLISKFRDMGLSDEGIKEAIHIFDYIWRFEPIGDLKFDRLRNLYEYLSSQAQDEGLYYSAVFWAPEQEAYAALDPENVQIIEAVVRTDDPEVTYHQHEEEFRIPVATILSYGPVGSQKDVKTADLWRPRCFTSGQKVA